MTNAHWTNGDVQILVDHIYEHCSQLGEGGNLVASLANGAAAHFASLGTPEKGGPKTPVSCKNKWKKV